MLAQAIPSNIGPVGVLFALGAGVCWALYIIWVELRGLIMVQPRPQLA